MGRRWACSNVGAASGRGVGRGVVASPSVANSSAVSTAPRTSSRSERLVGRLSIVGGNMCSESYESGRTETGRCKVSCSHLPRARMATRTTGKRSADDAPADRRRAAGSPLTSPPVGRSHTHRLRVRYGECDAQGVVFNAHYFAYFDVALTELWREVAGSYTAMMEQGVDLQVVEATARYRAPARFDDEIDVTIAVARLGTTSMVTRCAIHRDDGTLLVEGELAHVFVDARTLTKIPIPEAIRSALEG